MNQALLPASAIRLIPLLQSVTPSPSAIWLIGSRANGRANPTSDTDLLVFASESFLAQAAPLLTDCTDVDLLVVYDGDNFEGIATKKRGSLSSWGWIETGNGVASYYGGKFVPDHDVSPELQRELDRNPSLQIGHFTEYQERAIRLWPR